MNEDGTYEPKKADDKNAFNVHKEFFKVTKEEIEKVSLIN